MEFVSNEGKNVEIEAGGVTYLRHAIKIRFITTKDSYIDVLKEYVSDIYEEGDIISISENIIISWQNKVIKREEIKIGKLATFLSKFANQKNRGGYGVGMAINMQYAINKVGAVRVIFASIMAGITKLFGIKGVFYKIVGQEVSGLDGLYDGALQE